VERIVPGFAWAGIATRFLSRAERSWIHGFPPAFQREAFFYCWTRREAYGKACGTGMTEDRPVRPGNDPALVWQDDQPWCVRSFVPLDGRVAALAAAGSEWNVRFYDWHAGALPQA